MTIVKNVMTMPEIFQYAAEDGCIDNEITCSNRNLWLLVMRNNEFIGIINVHIEGSAVAYFHPYTLRKYKDQFITMCKEFLIWFKVNMPVEVVKLNALIPDYAVNAYKAALDIGMTTEGVDRHSYRKHGKIWDRYMMGIIRSDI